MLFSSYLPFLSFSHPAGVKNKWIYRQRTSITVAENEKKDRDGIGVFRHMYVHTYRYTRYRSFRPKKNDRSPFRVILRNFHESNRFFSFSPSPFLLFCLLHPSNDRLSNDREYFAIFSAIFRIIRLEERRGGEREKRFAGSIKPEGGIGEERGKRKSIRKEGRGGGLDDDAYVRSESAVPYALR